MGLSGRNCERESPNDDPDGDGLSNLQEYRVGSDPTDPNSGLLFVHAHQEVNIKLVRLAYRREEGGAQLIALDVDAQ